MGSSITVSTYLDSRRAKSNGLYPVKLQLYYNPSSGCKKRKYFHFKDPINDQTQTNDLDIQTFEKSYKNPKAKGRYGDIRRRIIRQEQEARDIISQMPYFSFALFEKAFHNFDTGSGFSHLFQKVINQHAQAHKIKTAEGYKHAYRKVTEFCKSKKINIAELQYQDINPEFLAEFENYMLSQEKKTNTISIYMRNIRAVFNRALERGDISRSVYPFGRGSNKYTIPASKNSKRSLDQSQLIALYQEPAKNDYEQRAKDYWFLSYALYGMNMKDMAELKKSDYQGDVIEFYRAKTSGTAKADQEKIVVQVTDFAKELIDKLKNPDPKSDYLLGVYDRGMTPKQKEERRSSILRSINRNLKNISVRLGFDFHVTTYYARHSYTTVALNNGASLELLKETLGHKNIKTTMNYVGSFKKEKLKNLGEQTTEFLKSYSELK